MKNITSSIVFLAMLSIGMVGCKTVEPDKPHIEPMKNLTHIETKNRYMLSSELDQKNKYHIAVVNIVLPKGKSTIVAAELTFGSFKPRDNGKVYIQAETVTLRYESIQNLVKALAEQAKDPPVGIFMLVDDIALGTEGSADADEDVMTFTRELDALLSDENVQQVYLIPDTFTISYK